MAKARSSLTFKGPANEKRVRKPPLLPGPLAKTSTVDKKKSVRKVARSDHEDGEDANDSEIVLSEKQKGKRRAVDVEPIEPRQEASRRGIKIAHHEASTSSTTVDKTWKHLSQPAKDELSKLAKQAETQISTTLKGSSSKSDFRKLLTTYRSSFDEVLDDLVCPPVPSTLKPRNASKNSIDFIDPETVKKKISATRLAVEEEEESIRAMEGELEQLKRSEARARSKVVGSDVVEQDEALAVMPVKKKHTKTVLHRPDEPSSLATTIKPRSQAAVPAEPHPSPVVSKPRKPILKPSLSVPRPDEQDDSDEFDTFPRPRSKPKTSTSKAVSKIREGSDVGGSKAQGTKAAETKKKKVRHYVEV